MMQRKIKAKAYFNNKTANLGNGVYHDAPVVKTIIGEFVSLYTSTKRFYKQNN